MVRSSQKRFLSLPVMGPMAIATATAENEDDCGLDVKGKVGRGLADRGGSGTGQTEDNRRPGRPRASSIECANGAETRLELHHTHATRHTRASIPLPPHCIARPFSLFSSLQTITLHFRPALSRTHRPPSLTHSRPWTRTRRVQAVGDSPSVSETRGT